MGCDTFQTGIPYFFHLNTFNTHALHRWVLSCVMSFLGISVYIFWLSALPLHMCLGTHKKQKHDLIGRGGVLGGLEAGVGLTQRRHAIGRTTSFCTCWLRRRITRLVIPNLHTYRVFFMLGAICLIQIGLSTPSPKKNLPVFEQLYHLPIYLKAWVRSLWFSGDKTITYIQSIACIL